MSLTVCGQGKLGLKSILLSYISSPFESVQKVLLASNPSNNYQFTVTSLPSLSPTGTSDKATSNSIKSSNLGEKRT